MNRWYVGGVKSTCDHTETSPGAREALSVAAIALVASMDNTVWVLCLPCPASPWGLPTTECMRCFTSAVSTDDFSTRIIATSLL